MVNSPTTPAAAARPAGGLAPTLLGVSGLSIRYGEKVPRE